MKFVKRKKKPLTDQTIAAIFAYGAPKLTGKHKQSSAERAMINQRKLSVGLGGGVRVLAMELIRKRGKHRQKRYATVGVVSRLYTPEYNIAKKIRDALDPIKAPGKVKTLADMTLEERVALERQYGVPIKVKED